MRLTSALAGFDSGVVGMLYHIYRQSVVTHLVQTGHFSMSPETPYLPMCPPIDGRIEVTLSRRLRISGCCR